MDISGATSEQSSINHPKAEEKKETIKLIHHYHLNKLGLRIYTSTNISHQSSSSEGNLNLEPEPSMKRLPHRPNRGID